MDNVIFQLFEKLFFKKRVVFCKQQYEIQNDNLIYQKGNYQLISDVTQDDLENIDCNRESINELCHDSSYYKSILFIVIYDKYEIASYYRAIIPKTDSYMHDSFSIENGKALLCNAYVLKPHRRKGLYSFMIENCHKYLLKRDKIDRVYTIVEESNIASLKANKRSGLKIAFENYLIKILGVNIISILKNKGGQKKYYYPFWHKLIR